MNNEPSHKLILLADNDMLVTRAYKAGLEQAGYTVAVAEDGDTALSQIRALHPDVVLLELLLPGQDGFTVLKTMKADQAVANIPVIVLTNLTQESDRNEAMNSGAVNVMLKDEVSIRDVLLAVQHHLVG